jgi:hypothetical protein
MDTAAVADQKPAKPSLDPTLKARRLARVREPRRKPNKLTLKTLDQLDLRCVAAKKVRQLVLTWENELGGADNTTESLRQLIQRAALLSVLIESSEAEWLAGGTLAEQTYFTAVNSLRRILTTLGLDRRARDVTPTLADIIEQAATRNTEAHQAATEADGDAE